MNSLSSFKDGLFKIKESNFEAKALELFRFQAQHNEVYAEYISFLGTDPNSVKGLKEIPFLPIEFFKDRTIKTKSWTSEAVFKSSGTTGSERSSHHIEDLKFYRNLSKRAFESMLFPLEKTVILAILPNYIEQGDSSLVYMIDSFIRQTYDKLSGFHKEEILIKLEELQRETGSKNVLILGVSFALLDLAESLEEHLELNNLFIMETGGMKGRRKEITRSELHNTLKKQTGVLNIYSEYGMTELLSQAYATENGKFRPPPWMKFLIRDVNDPFSSLNDGNTGALNIIDMANIHSCAFIETRDLAKANQDGSFDILGRMDNSDIRGCNLMVQ